MIVYLIGFMGVGKTTIGLRLADKMGVKFLDLDQSLEEQEGKSIASIIEFEGIRAFRRKERDLLRQISDQHSSLILATGGGTPCHYDGLNFMKKKGVVVYLSDEWTSIEARLLKSSAEQEKRPLLDSRSRKQWLKLYNKREPKYRQAHIICDLSAPQYLDLLTKSLHLFTKR